MRNHALRFWLLVVLLGLAACAPFLSPAPASSPEPTPASAPKAQLRVIEMPIVAEEVMGPGYLEYEDQQGGIL
jgi:hypothetical protein